MPPAYDLIIERGGLIVVETIEACEEDAAWRAGLMAFGALLTVLHESTMQSRSSRKAPSRAQATGPLWPE